MTPSNESFKFAATPPDSPAAGRGGAGTADGDRSGCAGICRDLVVRHARAGRHSRRMIARIQKCVSIWAFIRVNRD